jgi:RNase P/RNase MRP subunit POP5
MKSKKVLAIAGAAIVQTVLLFTPAQSQYFRDDRPDYDRSYRQTTRDYDRIIWKAYRDILQRDPDSEGLRYYRSRMRDYGWTEKEVQEDLWKSHEYGRQGSHMTRREAERIVRRAYLEVLGREPDPKSRPWVDKILYENWTEQDLVRELRESDEYRHGGRITRAEAERIVRRAYLDVLGREPDPGSRGWVEKVLNDHWTAEDVVRALRDSDEYRHRGRMTRAEAERIVRQAYRDVLGREPDPGSRGWVDKVVNDHWTAEDVVRALRDSDEYRQKHR